MFSCWEDEIKGCAAKAASCFMPTRQSPKRIPRTSTTMIPMSVIVSIFHLIQIQNHPSIEREAMQRATARSKSGANCSRVKPEMPQPNRVTKEVFSGCIATNSMNSSTKDRMVSAHPASEWCTISLDSHGFDRFFFYFCIS